MVSSGTGETNRAIAKRMGVTRMAVGQWRKRYRNLGLEELHDDTRSGHRSLLLPERFEARFHQSLSLAFRHVPSGSAAAPEG